MPSRSDPPRASAADDTPPAAAGAGEPGEATSPPRPKRKAGRKAPVVEEASTASTALAYDGYLAGAAGTVTVLGMGYVAWRRRALDVGWGLWPAEGKHDQHLTMGLVLVVCAAAMFAVELVLRLSADKGRVLSIAPAVSAKRWAAFARECLLVYAIELGLLTAAITIYKTAGEYGFGRGGDYYKPWFAIMEYFRDAYLWLGLPYVVATRALQHDPLADRKQAAFTVVKAAGLAWARLSKAKRGPAPFDGHDRTAVLGLFVKLFFVPLMTVFFADQFSHLVSNYGWLAKAIVSDPRSLSVRDFYNVSFSVLFSVDVGLAWGGYVVSSRWIKNTLFSVEPTVLGWAVALLCYPPFNRVFGFYFSTPGEHAFLSMGSPAAVTVLAVFAVASFVVYTAATVCFGLRFSNLTHRGIVVTGPYAYIRHPAYAAKNFSWWCVMAPAALYQAATQKSVAPLAFIVGLLALSAMYYLRAITEERHLGKDPEYRAYMQMVPWRFIPGVV